MEPDEPGADASTPGYFGTRLAHDPNRAKVWQHLTAYLSRWIAPDARVLELGAGWCDFANQVAAAEVVALDADATVESAARPGVTAVVGDCTDLSQFPDGRFDVVFASNLVEHLDRDAVDRLVDESHRVLAAGGRLILLQPNFRLAPGRYFDDYTHVSIWTDQSLGDFLRSRGWQLEAVFPRFLPLTLKSRGAGLTFLVPWYLRSPVKPLAGQMLVVARPMTWRDKTLCVVLPTYNERDSIAECIRRFEALPEVDEVLVVNNNAAPGTSEEVATTGAREVLETRQGYGAAIQRGLMETDADLVCLCEPDGTFDPEDLRKLLAFMPECDLVVGSRTVATFIWDGANMGWFLRWGNWGGRQVGGGPAQHDLAQRRRLHVPRDDPRGGSAGAPALHGERVRLRAGDDAAGRHPQDPDGPGPGELPPTGGGVLGDR